MTTIVTESNYQVTVVNENAVVVEIGVQGPPGASNSASVSVTPYGPITATTLQGAIEQLADQSFRSATTPTINIEEGDTWYDTTTDIMKVYKNGSWIAITLEPDLANATIDAGYF